MGLLVLISSSVFFYFTAEKNMCYSYILKIKKVRQKQRPLNMEIKLNQVLPRGHQQKAQLPQQ